ncbi:PREDICTED: uncharacterized protein LOC106813623, partial [Priapulus caudatus]|uniref:Uncharacterized protein LOC106813623 n=1 Tax=Priapulus caudatus TaxID=37621 RepID=A0ABM1EM73_PRICU
RPENGDGAGARSGGDCTLADPAEAVDESMENPDPESDRNPTSPTRLQYRVIDGSKRESPRDLKVRPHTWVGSDAEFTQKKEDSVSNALPKLRKITIPRPLSSFTPTGATSPLERAAPATKRYTYNSPFVSVTEQTSGAARASAAAAPPQKRSTLGGEQQ